MAILQHTHELVGQPMTATETSAETPRLEPITGVLEEDVDEDEDK